MSLNWNFQRGGGGGAANQKNLHGGSMDIFCKNTLLNIIKENKMGIVLHGFRGLVSLFSVFEPHCTPVQTMLLRDRKWKLE